MIVQGYKTKKVSPGDDLLTILIASLPKIQNGDIIAVTSKIVSICQGRVVPDSQDKHELIIRESDQYLTGGNQDITLTVKDNILIPNAGIDQSNGNGYLILWPEHIHKTCAEIWKQLKMTSGVNALGVIITDSHTTPLRWGTSGIGLSWCGFDPLKNYIGTPDIFGRKLRVTKANILDGLAAAAVAVMGEGNEQTPLALIRDVPFVTFRDAPPTQKEIHSLRIPLKKDIYAPILTSVPWRTKDI
ncbi:coenzyme F420-0:L-glutamate ligase [Candidatus Gottesmanbacteria bacterium]|nr:coenzyme F420-0:L-glutamate ligase [Candidatus Gottesmanbacteria bacterium]